MVKKNSQSKSAKSINDSSSKKKIASAELDDSFIIFSNSDKSQKQKKSSTVTSTTGSANHDSNSLLGECSKSSNTKKLIGGTSWTGKLPVNMLSEHCQKQNWEKPEYTMSKTSEGFSSMVILRAKNSKTKELVSLSPFKLPPSHKHLAVKPTALEARHFAATYGLFRVCSMRNLHMMMPPDYRALWKGEFEALKKIDLKEGRSWMYEADPFAVLRERDEMKATIEKKRGENEKARVIAAKTPTPGGVELALRNARSSNQASTGSSVHWGWNRVPKIEMGGRTRTVVEELIRKHAIWNPHDTKLLEDQKKRIIDDLRHLGFRQSHIEEAVEECKDREETVEWLLIHVPEDDLPTWALPEGYVAGISIASSDLKRESIIKRLAEAGYSKHLCKHVFDQHKDESKAAEALQKFILPSRQDVNFEESSNHEKLNESSEFIFEEEISSLQAVFSEKFSRLGTHVCRIILEPAHCDSNLNLILQVRRSQKYPKDVPIISIHAALPAYIRLSIVKQALNYAFDNLLGGQMIFFLIDWIEQHTNSIMERPGKLREISAAASSGVSDAPSAHLRKQNIIRHPKALDKTPNSKSRDDWLLRQSNSSLRSKILQRKNLPAWGMKEAIINTVSSHQVTIISGETGSGKSTQSAQFILDDLYQKQLGECTNILCTQPRRISAIGLAERVSDERCSIIGHEVGYIIRGESKKSKNTKITFVTTGVLLRRLQTSGGNSQDVISSLADVSHIIIDEVHERSLDTDFLLVLLRDVLKERFDLKLILMSATLDSGIFEDYFGNIVKVGKVEISGRTYPVEDYYLDDVIRMTNFKSGRGNSNDENDDTTEIVPGISSTIQGIGGRVNYELITQLVKEIDADLSYHKEIGGILIFMSGVNEINRALDNLRSIPNLHILPLHASLQSIEQRRVFPRSPSGKRKVIIATNVAETSITIDDIVAVIDTGRVKEISFDPQKNMRKLEEVWASRAACKQRRGRAGRVQAGKCYKLYTRNAEMTKMMERPEPEIRRVPLEQLCLSVRAMGIRDVRTFLANALTPPEDLAVESAMDLLGRIGALDGDELTALGRHLSMIPADLRCGKLMVYGAMFGCLQACVTIAAILTVKSPFVSPQEKREESKAARARFAQNHGDLIGDLRAFEQWSEMLRDTSIRQAHIRKWCSENFLSYQTLSDISSNISQYLSSLRELSFIPLSDAFSTSLMKHNSNISLIRSLCAGAFNPQLARIDFPDKKFAQSMSGAVELDPEAKTIKFFNQDNGRVFVHPSSTIFDVQSFPGNSLFLAYFNKIATSKVFIRELTPFNAYAALLFSGPITLDTLGRGLIVDGWLRMRGWARIGVLVSRLRGMLDDILAKKIDEPELDLAGNEVVNVVLRLIEFDGLDQ